ncbi:MAG: hypothetical protein ACE5JD_02655 [Candidatus Methylomirabilia bacterium]
MEKVPWLPAKLPEGVRAERCPQCGRRGLIPWTLRRDLHRQVWRTWVCAHCQATEDRGEEE